MNDIILFLIYCAALFSVLCAVFILFGLTALNHTGYEYLVIGLLFFILAEVYGR